MRFALTLVLALAALKLLVWWLEPRMAFFPFDGVQRTPAAYQLEFEDVEIVTADGETLHAWWLEAPEPRAQVIFWHGNGGNLALWLDVIAGMRRQEFSVLAVDYRGFGASTGRPSEQGLYRDADAALQVFEKRFRKTEVPLIHWGRSIGTPVAAYTASKVPPDALVLESPFADVLAIIGRNPVMRFLHLFSSYRFPTSRFLEHYDGPLLVIHGDADTIIPFRAGRRVFEEARGNRKTFVPIAGADHNDLHAANPVQYWRAIDAFVATIEVPNTREEGTGQRRR
jgi:uncharacterized protein